MYRPTPFRHYDEWVRPLRCRFFSVRQRPTLGRRRGQSTAFLLQCPRCNDRGAGSAGGAGRIVLFLALKVNLRRAECRRRHRRAVETHTARTEGRSPHKQLPNDGVSDFDVFIAIGNGNYPHAFDKPQHMAISRPCAASGPARRRGVEQWYQFFIPLPRSTTNATVSPSTRTCTECVALRVTATGAVEDIFSTPRPLRCAAGCPRSAANLCAQLPKLITASAFSFKSISGGIGVCGRLSFVACSRWNKSEASRYQLSLCYHFDAGLPNLFVVSTQQTRPSNIPRSCSEAVVMVATTAPVLGDAGCRLAAVNTSSLYVVVG